MGLQLSGLVQARGAQRDDFDGKVVAIDAPNLMYAFYSTTMLRAPTARSQAVRHALKGLALRIFTLAEEGARSVVVFDGPPDPRKQSVLAQRDASRKFPRLEAPDYARADELAHSLGVPVVRAPHDAEAQAAWMSTQELVDVVATTDWDALAMGARTLLRNFSQARPATWEIVTASTALQQLDLRTREQLAAAGVLMGCDYCSGLDGVGPKKALKLARTLMPDDLQAHVARVEGGSVALRALTHPEHAPVTLAWQRPSWTEAAPRLADANFALDDETRSRVARLSLTHRPFEVIA